jgi:hypothetical protein
MSTYKNKQKSTQLKSFLLHFWPRYLNADHLCEFNFLALLKFRKYETTNKTLLNHFPCCLSYGCTTHHLPGMNRKVRGTVQRSSRSLVRSSVVFASIRFVSLIAMILPVGLQAGTRVHRTHNSAIYKFT